MPPFLKSYLVGKAVAGVGQSEVRLDTSLVADPSSPVGVGMTRLK